MAAIDAGHPPATFAIRFAPATRQGGAMKHTGHERRLSPFVLALIVAGCLAVVVIGLCAPVARAELILPVLPGLIALAAAWLGHPALEMRHARAGPWLQGAAGRAARRHTYHPGWERRPMLDDLEYDDGESPAIGLVPDGVSWEEVQDHIKISHHPLLLLPAGGDQYAGAYWADTKMVVAEDLGSDQDQAVQEFREFLRERGEA